ncbi:MAG: hypothetical protein HW380_3381 [Magnetococcales bacterium]|nr:hypothetical protein [Magnetococcales bacterium]HIJ82896.1 hypothetical protein [Magnetococcales bacterium]
MRHMHWLLVVSMVWIVGMPILGIAEEPTEPPTQLEALTQRVSTLEQIWNREKKFLDDGNSLQQERLQLQISKQFNTLEREIQKTKDDLSLEERVLFIINFIAVGFIAGVLVWIKNRLYATMAKRMKTDTATLKDVAKKHNIERDWIKNGRITLLSLGQSKADELEKLIKDWGFKNIFSKVLTDFGPMDNDPQIVLFNDDICKDQEGWVWKYIQECSDDTVFVAYTKCNLPRDGHDQEWKKLITANMPATLFGQLMTAFRYQDALKRARS